MKAGTGDAQIEPLRTVWTPPCGGFETLAASTRNDLVALCDENGFAGPGPPKPVLYTSHDGGVTFHHRTTPAFGGAVASPTPSTVVIATGLVPWRTTDEGATWKIVANFGEHDGGSALELGFTTAAQGYVIESLGGVYITRDSGATWKHVTMP